MRIAIIAAAVVASSMFAGCSSPTVETDAVESQGEELSSNPPSHECAAVARQAALALEQLNGDRSRVTRADLVDGYSDRELARITIKRASQWKPKKDSYLVNTESMGGSPCYAYGVQVKSEQMSLLDDGAVIPGGPSSECADIAKKAVEAIARVNEQSVTISGTELVSGYSDHELLRVKIKDASGENDSYLVSTESLGGSPCLVYGLQLKSQEIDLLDGAH